MNSQINRTDAYYNSIKNRIIEDYQFMCPKCLKYSDFDVRSTLDEEVERVYHCPHCNSNYEFNDISRDYDYLQQLIFTNISKYQKEKKQIEEAPIQYPENATEEDEERVEKERFKEIELADLKVSKYIALQPVISEMLTQSYYLYKEEPVEAPE